MISILASLFWNTLYIPYKCMALLKRYSRSGVKGQGHDYAECYNSGGMHFDSVASRLTCLNINVLAFEKALYAVCCAVFCMVDESEAQRKTVCKHEASAATAADDDDDDAGGSDTHPSIVIQQQLIRELD